jgi:hypothetical protein
MRRFTPAEIEKLRELASWGHSGDAIARSLNRDPLSIRKKCCALGIRLRKPSPDHRRIKLSPAAWRALEVEADRLGTSPGRLARLCIEAAARDHLVTAIIDAPVPRWRDHRRATASMVPVSKIVMSPRLCASLY